MTLATGITDPNSRPEPLASPRLLTVGALCGRLSIGRTLAFELIRSKKIRSITIGRRRLIDAESVEQFIASRLAEQH